MAVKPRGPLGMSQFRAEADKHWTTKVTKFHEGLSRGCGRHG